MLFAHLSASCASTASNCEGREAPTTSSSSPPPAQHLRKLAKLIPAPPLTAT
jgi:hypothetical protein